DRASGPYKVQVWAEYGSLEYPQMSHPGASALFATPPEPPGPVGVRLAAEPSEEAFSVQWDTPFDDGGSAIECYELALFPPTPAVQAAGGAEAACGGGAPQGAAPAEPVGRWTTTEHAHSFAGLPPGSGPYEVEVRARTAAGLLGPRSRLRASTAVA
ncbi:unnamed protein product, partial [Prorocentrum cordatum]